MHTLLDAAANSLGRYADAAQHLTEALALDQLRGDGRGQAASLINLGELARVQEDLATAITLFGEAEVGPACRSTHASNA